MIRGGRGSARKRCRGRADHDERLSVVANGLLDGFTDAWSERRRASLGGKRVGEMKGEGKRSGVGELKVIEAVERAGTARVGSSTEERSGAVAWGVQGRRVE